MRKDMDRVIIGRGRRYAPDKTKRKCVPIDEDSPTWDPMSRSSYYSHNKGDFNDHLAPLVRYLRSRIGQPWNEIFKDIMASARGDSVSRYHLRGHVLSYVDTTGESSFYRFFGRFFYVDGDGLLQGGDGRRHTKDTFQVITRKLVRMVKETRTHHSYDRKNKMWIPTHYTVEVPEYEEWVVSTHPSRRQAKKARALYVHKTGTPMRHCFIA